MSEAILALNAGSSSLKFALFRLGGASDPALDFRGEIESTSAGAHFTVADATGRTIEDRRWLSGAAGDSSVGDLLDWIEHDLGDRSLAAVGHRIVHGGQRFVDPVRLTPDIVAALTALTPLDPLHQPLGLAPIKELTRLRPDLVQIACFDTAFHHALAAPVSRYALPLEYEAKGIRKYGFHGLSYEYIAEQLEEISPHLAGRRAVVAHLGNGASLCAMREGKSLDTTMGFSTLDGLAMGTRCGAIDPGVLLYLLREEALSPRALEDLLYHKSGLLGVSGISGDMRTLLASPEPRAKAAVELFVFRASREIAALANTLGGLELLVFTGGIGEHAAPVRAMIAARLNWLGVEVDVAANDESAERIDTPQSRVEVRVIPTNEELTIARHVARLRQARTGRLAEQRP
jgi:acetate kinase